MESSMAREPAVPLSEIDGRLTQIERELERLEPLRIERAMLLRLRDKAVNGRRRPNLPASVSPNGNAAPKVTDAIISAVRTEPGLTKDQIVERIKGVVSAERRIVLTTIGNLARAKRILPDDKGGYVPV